MKIVEISQVSLSRATGMGRVSAAWHSALRACGHVVTHVGPEQVGELPHPIFFAQRARRWLSRHDLAPDLLLVHEPAGAAFVGGPRPVFVFSHGIERRGWETGRRWRDISGERVSLRSRLLFPIWRLRACDRSMKRAEHVFVLNSEDREFCLARYGRGSDAVSILRNGVDPVEQVAIGRVVQVPTVLFIGSWLRRKGVSVLVRAAARLHRAGVIVRWVLAGTGVDRSTVFREWPRGLEEVTEVIPSFPAAMESEILRRADIFVLPSFFEGQPLSLLQAMAAGLCCISTATCGQKELLIHEGNGLLAEVGDDMGLTHLLERAIADEGLRAELGSAARGSVAERSWEAVGREFVDMLEERIRALGFSSAMQK